MDLDQLHTQLTRAARESVRADWLADKHLAEGNTASDTLAWCQGQAVAGGISQLDVARLSRLRVVVDTRTSAVEILGIDQLDEHHRTLWPTIQSALDDLGGLAPEGMDPELVEERITGHLSDEATWGGVWLDCTQQQLISDLTRHYSCPVNPLRDAS